jgi:ligand-binding sensor protein
MVNLMEEKGKFWEDLLEEISSKLQMVASLVDENGRILLHKGTYQEICERVRSDDKTLTFICGQTSTALMKEAEIAGSPVVDVCQIGLCKVVIPIFQSGRMAGAVTACGGLLEGEEPDVFMVSQELGITEGEAETLFRGCPNVEEERAKEIAGLWRKRIEEIIQEGSQ